MQVCSYVWYWCNGVCATYTCISLNAVCVCVCCVCALTNEWKQSNCQDVQEEDVHNRTKAVHNVHQDPGDGSQCMYEHNTQCSLAYVHTITLANQIHLYALRMSNKLRGIQVQTHTYVRTSVHQNYITIVYTQHQPVYRTFMYGLWPWYILLVVSYCLALHINLSYIHILSTYIYVRLYMEKN